MKCFGRLRNYFRKAPAVKKKLPEYCELASKILQPDTNLKGSFPKGEPSGVTVHYTASRDVENTHRALIQRGYNYHFMIGRDGEIVQTAKLTHKIWHAGKAIWNGKSPNRTHIAIALLSWGLLRDGKNWTGGDVLAEEIAHRNGCEWDMATNAQEDSLVKLCAWLVKYDDIEVDSICGHDECGLPEGRKVDPGGVLSFSMAGLRSTLKNDSSVS